MLECPPLADNQGNHLQRRAHFESLQELSQQVCQSKDQLFRQDVRALYLQVAQVDPREIQEDQKWRYRSLLKSVTFVFLWWQRRNDRVVLLVHADFRGSTR